MVLSPKAAWIAFESGATIGKSGSEGGTILREEVHTDGARITLERLSKRRLFRNPVVTYAITCGVYGWMVHTRFFDSESVASTQYEAMKLGLVEILNGLPLENDPEVEQLMQEVPPRLHSFIAKFP